MKPFGWVALSFILGIFIAYYINIPFFCAYILCVIFLLLAIVNINKKTFSLFLLASNLLLGFLVYRNSVSLPENHISNFVPLEKARLQGMVISDVDSSITEYGTNKIVFTMTANSLIIEDKQYPVMGLVKTYVFGKDEKIAYGNSIVLEGKLYEPEGLKNPGGFNYRRYLNQEGIYTVMKIDSASILKIIGKEKERNKLKEFTLFIRKKADSVISSYLPFSEASFLDAVLLGQRKDLSYELKDAFIKTGTVHILAISGLHIGLIAFILYVLFNALRLNRKFAALLTILLLIFYAIMTGSQIPVVRATIMISIILVGGLLKRSPSSINLLALAAVIILLVNPKALFSASFQLSFVAVLSLFHLTPKINELLKMEKFSKSKGIAFRLASYILKLFSISIAAWMGVLPLVAYYFNIVSPITIFGNLIVIPLTFFIIAASLSFIIFSFLAKPIGLIFASTASIFIQFLQFVIEKLSNFPFAYFRIKSPSIFTILVYYAIVLMVFNYKQLKLSKMKSAIIILVIPNLIIWPPILIRHTDRIEITFLDVGEGDAAFIKFPCDGNMLIDGGKISKRGDIDMGRNVIIPFLCNKGVHKIDAIMLSHSDTDHVGGLCSVLDNFKVSYVFDSGSDTDGKPFRVYKDRIKKKRINYYKLRKGNVIIGYKDTTIYILHPDDPERFNTNDGSLVLKIAYKGKAILFCGDIMENGAKELLDLGNNLKTTIIKVPHHGRDIKDENIRNSFFGFTKPEVAIISGSDSSTLSNKTVTQLLLNDAKIYHTKRTGAIIVQLDEKGFSIDTIKD